MIDDTLPEAPRAKRTDVGYKRPPVEHRFRPGQKPPPRKRRAAKPPSLARSLAKILAEERRLTIGGKARWFTNARLLVEVAFKLAEDGNPTLSRALADYLMVSEPLETPSDEPLIEIDPEGETGVFHYTRRVRI